MTFNEDLIDFLLELWIKYRKLAIHARQMQPTSQSLYNADKKNEEFDDNVDLPDLYDISNTLFELMLYFCENNFLQEKDIVVFVAKIKSSFLKEEILDMLNTQNPAIKQKFSKSSELLKRGLTGRE